MLALVLIYGMESIESIKLLKYSFKYWVISYSVTRPYDGLSQAHYIDNSRLILDEFNHAALSEKVAPHQ